MTQVTALHSDPLPTNTDPRTPWRPVAVVWSAYGVLSALQEDYGMAVGGHSMPLWHGFAVHLPIAASWALATFGILWLGKRVPLSRWHGGGIAVHALACAAIVLLQGVMVTLYIPLIPMPPETVSPILTHPFQLFLMRLIAGSFVYVAVLSIGYLGEARRRARAQELQASRMEGQIAAARLEALKMQLQPHFLFNVLNTIGGLVRTGEGERAVDVLARLGNLLRIMLDGASAQLVPLKEELTFIETYLEIEAVRFKNRLDVRWTIEDDTRDAQVPHLILQPLVENAIRHGIARRAGAGRLEVTAGRAGDRLLLRVRDDGPGLGQGRTTSGTQIGLANTRRRLWEMFHGDAKLQVYDGPAGGVCADLDLPFRVAAPRLMLEA